MKPLTRASRAKLGKRSRATVPWSVKYFATVVHDAIQRGDNEATLTLGLGFIEQFKACWQSGNASFFRDLATCIETKCGYIPENYENEVWLRQRLFRNKQDPEKQTDFLTHEQLCNELEKEFPGVSLEYKQLDRYMKRIDAVYARSSRRRPA